MTAALVENVEAASEAGLRYVSDQMPGIRRRRRGDRFFYVGADGRPVRDSGTLERIRGLAIPPAWTDVWICQSPHGHIQATGRDSRGRKQYRYNGRWREVRDATKFDRMVAFGEALPRIRRRVARDIASPDLSRAKVLAAVVRLLDASLVRVGNDEYAEGNGSFGLTTMRDHHVRVRGSDVLFVFRGKHGRKHEVDVEDGRLARIVRRMQELPGQRLFQYVGDDGELHALHSEDVNEYIRAAAGDGFSTKDFRTWAGTVLAARELREMEPAASEAQAKRNLVELTRRVAAALGNTPAVCRRCYMHPAIVDSYAGGTFGELPGGAVRNGRWRLSADEAAVLALLRQRRRRATRRAPRVA